MLGSRFASSGVIQTFTLTQEKSACGVSPGATLAYL